MNSCFMNYKHEENMYIKPFLKWPGGKYRILPKILEELPEGTRYVEPFAGSCSVYLNANIKYAIICDINRDLIDLYKLIKAEGKEFISFCKTFFNAENNTKEKFYKIRNEFNQTQDQSERCARFLYLNRHCFNGLVRYNSKSEFNVPFGKYKNPYFPYKELINFYHRTQEVDTEFICCDFREVFKSLTFGDVVYCDPPYLPLSATSNFTNYSGSNFSVKDQYDLASLSKIASNHGVNVIISNHDTELSRELYNESEIKFFNVQRYISCKGSSREEAPEILAIFR